MQQTADGGYIIVGSWLIKTDSQGNEEWINESISGRSVQQTTDGGYIITGTNSGDIENGDVWLIKTDSQGQEEWIQTYGENSLFEWGTSVQQTTDGGYIITGVVGYYDEFESLYYVDVLLLKTDSQGDTLWTNTLGSEDINIGNSVQQTADNGYIVTGWMRPNDDDENVLLIKTDSNGNEEWNQTFGGSSNDAGNSVQQTEDGGYIITGYKYSFGDHDVWLIKTASNGDSLWTRIIGGSISDMGNSVQQTADGGYIIAGNTSHFNGNVVLLIKTDSLGNVDLGTELVINEIMQNPSAVNDSDGEWFEIFNSGNFTWDLNEWTIKDAGTDNHTTSSLEWSSLYINPGEYLVLGNNSDYNTNGGVNVDYQYSDITLANGADEIILINTYGTVFDSVAYDGGTTFPDPTGESMALVHPDSNNNVGTNWQESTTSYGDGDLGTPGLPNFLSDISLNLTSLDFDTVNVNESGVLNLTISNDGNGPLQLDSLYTNSTLFILSFTDSLIDISAVLQVTFTPTEFGPGTATLYIESNDPDESLVEVSLIGFGYYPSPDIELESTSIDFGGVMDGLTGTQLLYVYNTGDTGLELDTMYCTGNFSVIPGNGIVDAGDTL
ncbi:MAG TPA: choice-of-anchor D domain-containing protein, partial [Candidatus Marinimicrobia bacterium]|nr:choice-of-anchor D domain-containing protein [Candidatus Neomarinimicrobiota bacterium]